ncbi:NADPH-dependent FMN reductase [Alcaligenaceae bacterium]|nr:NADPH-dependent FMN reductase [Alcaligenaceae bacterium]
MSILTIAGSPSSRSRSSSLLHFVSRRLIEQGFRVEQINLRDIPAEDLIGGHYKSAAACALRKQVSRCKVVLIASPVYKASFAGGLKALLDLLDEKSLSGKLILPIASGGSAGHLLALEYGFKPVLSALGAQNILTGVYATDAQVQFSENGVVIMAPDVLRRLEESLAQITEYVQPEVAQPTVGDSLLRCKLSA